MPPQVRRRHSGSTRSPFWRAMATIAAGMLAPALLACGGSGQGTGPGRGPASATTSAAKRVVERYSIHYNYSTHDNDRDNDGDHNDDDEGVLKYGQAADTADRRSSAALVRSYFAAAAHGDGARGCALLAPFIAEAVPEDDGRSPRLRGGTCAVVLTKLFRQLHREFELKYGSLRVIGVRMQGDKALAIVDFPAIPEVRQLNERRFGASWRLLELRDDNLE